MLPLFSHNQIFEMCGCPETLASTTILRKQCKNLPIDTKAGRLRQRNLCGATLPNMYIYYMVYTHTYIYIIGR